MIKIRAFTFNIFGENTYILSDESGKCVIIDPGCYELHEKDQLSSFIKENALTPVRLLNTHCHIDHVLGNGFVAGKYNLLPEIHKDDLYILNGYPAVAQLYGVNDAEPSPQPQSFLKEGDNIMFGESRLEVLHIPGHAPGHVVFLNSQQGFVIGGDVLFYGSIGRTDMPGGDHEALIGGIKTKLFRLPDNYVIYSGHGQTTTIGFEKMNNPFLQ